MYSAGDPVHSATSPKPQESGILPSEDPLSASPSGSQPASTPVDPEQEPEGLASRERKGKNLNGEDTAPLEASAKTDQAESKPANRFVFCLQYPQEVSLLCIQASPSL